MGGSGSERLLLISVFSLIPIISKFIRDLFRVQVSNCTAFDKNSFGAGIFFMKAEIKACILMVYSTVKLCYHYTHQCHLGKCGFSPSTFDIFV